MKRSFKGLIALITLILLSPLPSFACTLWAATGTAVEGGGTLIAKNRDWAPDNVQVIQTVQPKSGYRYVGLYAEDNDEPGLKAGLNEKGLVWISASASSIPAAKRDHQPGQHGVGPEILNRYATVDDLVAHQSLFAKARAGFCLVADSRKIAVVEIGLGGKYAVKVTDQGVVAHTNHYLDPTMAVFNESIGKSSATRFGRVTSLLATAETCSLARFLTISGDKHDGPNNSLWRTGSKADSEQTLAAWIVQLVPGRAPVLYVTLANPGAQVQEFRYTVDNQFLAAPLKVGR